MYTHSRVSTLRVNNTAPCLYHLHIHTRLDGRFSSHSRDRTRSSKNSATCRIAHSQYAWPSVLHSLNGTGPVVPTIATHSVYPMDIHAGRWIQLRTFDGKRFGGCFRKDTQSDAMGALQIEWVYFIQVISLQKASAFSRLHYLAMLNLENLTYPVNSCWNFYINQNRNWLKSVKDRNGKKESPQNKGLVERWRGFAVPQKNLK